MPSQGLKTKTPRSYQLRKIKVFFFLLHTLKNYFNKVCSIFNYIFMSTWHLHLLHEKFGILLVPTHHSSYVNVHDFPGRCWQSITYYNWLHHLKDLKIENAFDSFLPFYCFHFDRRIREQAKNGYQKAFFN